MTLSIYSLDEARRLSVDWPDVYFAPGFGRVSEISDGGRWHVAIWGDGEIIYPFLRRETEIPDCFDISSPYGYAGIFADSRLEPETLARFRKEFREWARQTGIVSEFIRMSSLISDQTRIGQSDDFLDISLHNRTIRLDIGVDYETYFSGNEGRSRTKVRKARRLGYTSDIAVAGLEFFDPRSAFRRLYHGTMTAAGAKPYYFFSDEYFEAIQRELGQTVYSVTVWNAEGDVAMAGFFFVWKEMLHVHLDGATRQALRDGVGNYFFDICAAWGCENPQLKWMHIGGGLREGDSLYKFKMSFGGTPTDYYLGRSVFDQEAYDMLVAKRAADLGVETGTLIESGFFPAFRATPE